MSCCPIALVCAGVGVVDRGFERYARELFDTVRDEVDVTLFKGAGPSGRREVALSVPRRNGLALRRLPFERALRLELAAFTLRLLPHLVRGRFRLVHYVEPYVGNLLAAARRRLGLRFSLLLTDGLGLTAWSSRRADLLHVVTPLARAALEGSRPPERLFYVPHGIRAGAFASGPMKEEARRRLGLPAGRTILLDVAALNRRHKRSHVLIEQAARLGPEHVLVLAGVPEERELLELGRERLGERFRQLQLPPDAMPALYASADVFVHAAREEGFCLAAVEAMAAGLPVLLHRAPHFAWLVEDERQLVDFTEADALGSALERLPGGLGDRNRERAREFDWSAVAPLYLDLYRRSLELAAV